MENKTDKNQKIKKYAIFAIMFLIFGAVMWFIYAPSQSDREKKESRSGFNANIPAPKNDAIVADKKAAYEQEQMRLKQEEKMKSLQEYSFILDEAKDAKSNLKEDEMTSPTSKNASTLSQKSAGGKKSSVGSSTDAYRDINKTLGSFYEKPKEDEEKKEMQEKIEKLEALLSEKNEKPVDPLYLMEKSYELAAKYAPQNGQLLPSHQAETDSKDGNTDKSPTKKGKAAVSQVSQVREQIVSGLSQPMSDAEFVRQMSVPRNMGFHTVDDAAGQTVKNTISACIHDDQVLVEGAGNDEARKTVRLRLTEPMKIDEAIIPENTVITGKVNFQGERLGINVSSIEYEGRIIPVDMNAYDLDGQFGIYVPGSMDINAAKEIIANMGTNIGSNIGSSVSISQQSAGDQLLADLGRSAIQGTSQYASKKIRLKKVTLKSGYQILLLPAGNQ